MNDQVEAMFQRTLNVRTGEGVIGGGPDAAGLRERCNALEIDELEERIGRRFDPEQAGAWPDGRFDRGGRLGEIEIAHLEPRRSPANALEQPPRPPVEV